MKKLIINLAPTGLDLAKETTPYVPITPDEISTDVMKCAELGVSMVHLHTRDSNGGLTYKRQYYERVIDKIKQRNKDLILVVSTSGRIFQDFQNRSEVLEIDGDLKPDMASLTLSSLNLNRSASINSPSTIMRLAEKMLLHNIKPELEVCDLGMVNFAHYLIKKELIKPPYYFNILLGNVAGAQAKLLHLGLIVSELPENSYWSVAGIGNYQKSANALGIIEGDGVRVGLEDNYWYDEARSKLATNYLLVERIVRIAEAVGRRIAAPGEVRQWLHL